jgi:hypothetical protein
MRSLRNLKKKHIIIKERTGKNCLTNQNVFILFVCFLINHFILFFLEKILKIELKKYLYLRREFIIKSFFFFIYM